MSTAVTPLPDQNPGLSQIERVADTFYAPTKTFIDINRNSNWILAWVIMVLCSLAYSTTVGAKIGWDRVSATQMRFAPASRQQQIESLPADQKAHAMAMNVKITKSIAYGFQLLGLVWMVIVALVLWLTFTFGLGAEISYAKSLAIVVFASLPGIFKAILGIVVIMAGIDPDLFIIQNPVGTNPGYYLNFAETNRFIYSVASALDIFTIWVLILTAIGFSVVAKVKRGTAMTVIFGWWILVTLVGAGFGAAFS